MVRAPVWPYGDQDKCWGCGLPYTWSGIPQMCTYCAELDENWMKTEPIGITVRDIIPGLRRRSNKHAN